MFEDFVEDLNDKYHKDRSALKDAYKNADKVPPLLTPCVDVCVCARARQARSSIDEIRGGCKSRAHKLACLLARSLARSLVLSDVHLTFALSTSDRHHDVWTRGVWSGGS